MVAIEHRANSSPSSYSSPITITEHGIMTPARVFGYDTPKTADEHYHDFHDIGGAIVHQVNNAALALQCGVKSGLVVIRIGKNRGDFIPNLDAGSYGVEHTCLGNLVTKTKRIIDVENGTAYLIFGIVPEQWLDGLNSCTLVQPDLEERGAIDLLADDESQSIEPTAGYRFYTLFFHRLFVHRLHL